MTALCRVCGYDGFACRFSILMQRKLPETINTLWGECQACGSISLLDHGDASQYYKDYDSQKNVILAARSKSESIVGHLSERLLRATSSGLRLPQRDVKHNWFTWLSGTRVAPRETVLDVVYGGSTPNDLYGYGFGSIVRINPPLLRGQGQCDPSETNKCILQYVEGTYDFIVLSYVLERLDNPVATLKLANDKLSEDGRILVTLPVVAGSFWERYRDNMATIDSPINRFIPSISGLESMCRKAGLAIRRCKLYSPPDIYAASEVIRWGISVHDARLRDVVDRRHWRWCKRVARADAHGNSGAIGQFILSRDGAESG